MRFALIVSILSFAVSTSAKGDFSAQAQKRTEKIARKIIEHPFIKELAAGNLRADRYQYYNRQDGFYNWRYGQTLALLASRVSNAALAKFLLQGANNSMWWSMSLNPVGLEQCPRCKAYSDFEELSAYVSSHQGIGAISPCYILYWHVATWVEKNSVTNNPYKTWIDSWTSKRFGNNVHTWMQLVDNFASKLSDEQFAEMLQAYEEAAWHEYYMFDSAWNLDQWQP